MGLVINTNTQSIFAQRALSKNTSALQLNIEHLSTGYRVNRAADDAAGLSIANKLTTTIRGLQRAKQNSGDGISLVQTAEGGLGIIQENLQRIRELTVQGISGTNGTNEINALQREINERVKVIGDIASSTKFNGVNLLYNNATATATINLQTGADAGQTTTIDFRTEQSGKAFTGIEVDISQVRTGSTSDYGHVFEGISTTGFALDKIQLAGASVNSYNYATHTSNVTLSLADVDTMIDNISRMRSYLGAAQNALESKIEYMDIAIENSLASRSRIQDVDVAYESSILVKNQILQQSAASMLLQANSSPQIALKLIQGG